MNAQPSIESVSVVDAIESRIKQMLVSGKLEPGQRLPSERNLQNQLGVSRLPLREALARLQALGLIRIRHGKGAFVESVVSRTALSDVLIPFFPKLSVERLSELIDARAFLESELTILATERATAEDLDKLDRLAANDPKFAQDFEALADADYAFHHEISRIARNEFLAMMHEALGPHIRSFIVAYAKTDKDRLAAINRNIQLAQAIRVGDSRVAGKMAREHLQPCLKSITAAAIPTLKN